MTASLRVTDLLHAGLGPEAVAAFGALSDAGAADFVEGYLAEPLLADPRHAPDELWPAVTARTAVLGAGLSRSPDPAFTVASAGAGVNPLAATDPRTLGTGAWSGSILRALLYCHGVVIEDPIALACDIYRNSAVEHRDAARVVIEIALINQGEIAPLLDEGIVRTFFADRQGEPGRVRAELIDAASGHITIPEDELWELIESVWGQSLPGPLRTLWGLIRDGDSSPPLELIRTAVETVGAAETERFIHIVERLRVEDAVVNAIDTLAMAIVVDRQLGGAFDLYVPTRAHRTTLAQLLGVADLRLTQLGRTDVPGLDGLGMADVVAIRRDSEAFEQWRRHLGLGLERVRQLGDAVTDDHEAAQVVAESLALGRETVFDEVRRSTRLAAASGEALTLTAGVFGGAVGGATAGPVGMLVGAAGGALPVVAARAASWLRRPPGWLRRHWFSFERADR